MGTQRRTRAWRGGAGEKDEVARSKKGNQDDFSHASCISLYLFSLIQGNAFGERMDETQWGAEEEEE